jgi:hypothetical protein
VCNFKHSFRVIHVPIFVFQLWRLFSGFRLKQASHMCSNSITYYESSVILILLCNRQFNIDIEILSSLKNLSLSLWKSSRSSSWNEKYYSHCVCHSGNRVRPQSRRSWVRIPQGCKAFKSFIYIECCCRNLLCVFFVYLRKVNSLKKLNNTSRVIADVTQQ